MSAALDLLDKSILIPKLEPRTAENPNPNLRRL
jgi:hypothetical protein